MRKNNGRYPFVVNVQRNQEGGDYEAPMANQKWFIDFYKEGYEAFFDGKLDCPFQPNTRKYQEWNRGFNAAYFSQRTRRHA